MMIDFTTAAMMSVVAMAWTVLCVALGYFLGFLAKVGEGPIKREFDPGEPGEYEEDAFREAMEPAKDEPADENERVPTMLRGLAD